MHVPEVQQHVYRFITVNGRHEQTCWNVRDAFAVKNGDFGRVYVELVEQPGKRYKVLAP